MCVNSDDATTIARLLIQFVEQAEGVEKDVRLLADKDFDDGTYCVCRCMKIIRCCRGYKLLRSESGEAVVVGVALLCRSEMGSEYDREIVSESYDL